MPSSASPAAPIQEWTFWKTLVVMLALTPFAVWIAFRMLSYSIPETFIYPTLMLLSSALLSVAGVSLSPSAKWNAVAAAAIIVIGALFIIWLFTSSIGGWKPTPFGILFAFLGSSTGLVSARIPLHRTRIRFAATIWICALILGTVISATNRSSINLAHLKQLHNAPAYVENHVIGLLLKEPGPVTWKYQGALPGYEDVGGGFGADGTFHSGRDQIHLEIFGNRAAYGITVHGNRIFNYASMRDPMKRAESARAWLKELGVREENLTELNAIGARWSATGPLDLGDLYISDRGGSVLISGHVQLPQS